MFKTCVIFDIDGTVANIDHRRHFVEKKPKNWTKFNEMMVHDTPNDDIVALVNMFHEKGETVFGASGRDGLFRDVTEKWLTVNGVLFHKLFMRQPKDNRADFIIKKEILDQIRAEGFEPWLVFDDRDQVVEMWRANGIRCLQVAPGGF